MNIEMVVLRLLHIVFGVFWAGSAVFFAFVLEPRLRALGPAIQRPVMGSLSRVMGPALGGSGAITIAAGITLALRLRWNTLDRWFDTGWGWAHPAGLHRVDRGNGYGDHGGSALKPHGCAGPKYW